MGVPAEAGAFIGALLAGLLASAWRSAVHRSWLAPHLGYPRICLTVPSIVIMVPGLYMYRAMWYLGSFQTMNALDWGVPCVHGDYLSADRPSHGSRYHR